MAAIPVETLLAHVHGVATIKVVRVGGQVQVCGGGEGLLEVVQTPDGVRVSIQSVNQIFEMTVPTEMARALVQGLAPLPAKTPS